ncbi:MAG: hypothetical protein AAF290_02735 [Pseudomonadota bacterium]
MRIQTLLITGVLAGALVVANAAADNRGKRNASPQQKVERMTEELGLFDDQVPQIEAILTEAAAKRQEIGDSYTLNQRSEARAAMRSLREETETQIAAVLTDEQAARLAELKAERKERRVNRRIQRMEGQLEETPEA